MGISPGKPPERLGFAAFGLLAAFGWLRWRMVVTWTIPVETIQAVAVASRSNLRDDSASLVHAGRNTGYP